jgi:hypothetical protein
MDRVFELLKSEGSQKVDASFFAQGIRNELSSYLEEDSFDNFLSDQSTKDPSSRFYVSFRKFVVVFILDKKIMDDARIDLMLLVLIAIFELFQGGSQLLNTHLTIVVLCQEIVGLFLRFLRL